RELLGVQLGQPLERAGAGAPCTDLRIAVAADVTDRRRLGAGPGSDRRRRARPARDRRGARGLGGVRAADLGVALEVLDRQDLAALLAAAPVGGHLSPSLLVSSSTPYECTPAGTTPGPVRETPPPPATREPGAVDKDRGSVLASQYSPSTSTTRTTAC